MQQELTNVAEAYEYGWCNVHLRCVIVARRVGVLNTQPSVYNVKEFTLDGITSALSLSFVKCLPFENEKGSPFFSKIPRSVFG